MLRDKFSNLSVFPKYYFCIILIGILLNTSCFSQPVTWQRTYQGPSIIDSGYQICSAPGGNFYFVGYSGAPNHVIVLKINGNGELIWTRLDTSSFSQSLTSKCCASLPDGGCIISGYGNLMYTIKLDSAGNYVWKKKYDNIAGSHIICEKIISLSDGSCYGVGGFYLTYPNSGICGWDMRLGAQGILKWSSIFGGNENYKLCYSAVEGLNFGFIVAGYNKVNGVLKALISHQGILPAFGFDIDSICDAQSAFTAIVRSGSAYYVCGNYLESAQKYQAIFVKVDILGNALFQQHYQSPVSEKALDLKMINPNKFVISILRDSANGQIQCGKVITVDSNGVILQSKIFPAVKYLALNSILPMSDGGIIFAGTYDYGNYWPEHGPDFYAVRTDSFLNFPDMPPIGIQNIGFSIPIEFKVYQNYPNPFNPSTKIKFDLPKDANVTIEIYDMLGRITDILAKNEFKKAGSYEIEWNASGYSSGVYVYRIRAGNFVASRKMISTK